VHISTKSEEDSVVSITVDNSRVPLASNTFQAMVYVWYPKPDPTSPQLA